MNLEQHMVKEFHESFDSVINNKPIIVDVETYLLRMSLMDEELDELKTAMDMQNIVEIADGLADLLYVVYGTAVSYGLDMEPIFKEVHRSNMTKVGGHKREDGRWIRPPTYSPKNLNPLIEEMSK